MDINLIVAAGKKGEIGKKGELIWKISDDLKRFKALTMGHPVIMGRKTWESLPKKPLPGRTNIIITRQKDYYGPEALVVSSPQEALQACDGKDPFIIGGQQIYNLFLPLASSVYLTQIDAECLDADAFLELDLNNFKEMPEETSSHISPEGIAYRFLHLQKAR